MFCNYLLGGIYLNKTLYCDPFSAKGLLDVFVPSAFPGTNYKTWVSALDLRTCFECREKHGQIYEINETVSPAPKLHNRCRCIIKAMDAVFAGTATKNGNDGADFWIKNFSELPNYYISLEKARAAGWRWGQAPAK